MIIFLLTAVPLFYLIRNSLIEDDKSRIDDSFKPFIYGIICFIPAVIIYNIVRQLFLEPEYTVKSIYFYYLLHDHLVQFFLSLAAYFLVFGFRDLERDSNGTGRLFAFMCGFYSLWSINDIIIEYGWYNSHLLILLPVLRLSIITAGSMILSMAMKNDGIKKYLLLFVCILLPFIGAIDSLFWRLSYTVPILVITILIAALSGYMFFIMIQPGSLRKKSRRGTVKIPLT